MFSSALVSQFVSGINYSTCCRKVVWKSGTNGPQKKPLDFSW